MGVLAGDGFFVLQVLEYRFKGWIGKMLVPCLFFFGISCLVSLYSIVVKLQARMRAAACALHLVRVVGAARFVSKYFSLQQ